MTPFGKAKGTKNNGRSSLPGVVATVIIFQLLMSFTLCSSMHLLLMDAETSLRGRPHSRTAATAAHPPTTPSSEAKGTKDNGRSSLPGVVVKVRQALTL